MFFADFSAMDLFPLAPNRRQPAARVTATAFDATVRPSVLSNRAKLLYAQVHMPVRRRSVVVYDVMGVGLFHFWIFRKTLVQDPDALGVG